MKVLEFITRYSKRFLGIGLVAVLTMVQLTAGASTTVQDSIRSRGYITYDPDLDGSPDMAFYSEDLVRIGAGVDSLNDNISELTTKYDELASTSDMYRTNIIDALNTNVYKNSNLPGTTSFLEIISAVQNIPSPTTASGAYYGSGDNNTLGVGISDTNTPVDVPVENVYSLDLGISEQITLPAGYYGDPITIRNGVANRGRTLSAIALSYLADANTPIETAWYTDIKDAIDSAYAKGFTDGSTGSNPVPVDVIYHINHTHGSYCYPTAEPVFVNDKSETKSEYDSDRGTHYNDYGYTAWYKCSVCGATYSATRSTTHEWDFDDGLKSQARTDAYNKVRNNHLVNGTYCPANGYQCGKEDGEQDITDVSVLGAGDSVVSATIMY